IHANLTLEQPQFLEGGIRLHREGAPEESAEAILFLTSDASRYITGPCSTSTAACAWGKLHAVSLGDPVLCGRQPRAERHSQACRLGRAAAGQCRAAVGGPGAPAGW